jgi:hypothetical integral membrane protein (TIGR02206 family)
MLFLAAALNPDFPPLEPYGPAHLIVLALTFGLPILLRAWVNAGPAEIPRLERLRWPARALGALILVTMPAKLIYTLSNFQKPWQEMLPLQLCDLAAIFIVIALFTYRQAFFELSYYWGLAGTFQALLTPDLAYGFPHPYFFFFFISHAGIVAGALTLIVAGGMRPSVRGGINAFIALLGYAACMVGVNYALGVNYGYLLAKPRNRSLMDFLWDWPFYIAQLAVLAAFFFLILYLPHAPFWRRKKVEG